MIAWLVNTFDVGETVARFNSDLTGYSLGEVMEPRYPYNGLTIAWDNGGTSHGVPAHCLKKVFECSGCGKDAPEPPASSRGFDNSDGCPLIYCAGCARRDDR